MRIEVSVCILLQLLVVTVEGQGRGCYDRYSKRIRYHNEIWERQDIPCSRMVCLNGRIQQSYCKPPSMLGQPGCSLVLNPTAPFPSCCPSVTCVVGSGPEPKQSTTEKSIMSTQSSVTQSQQPTTSFSAGLEGLPSTEPTVIASTPTDGATDSSQSPVPTDSTPPSTDPTNSPAISTGDPNDSTPITTGDPTDSTPVPTDDPTDSTPVPTGDPTDSTEPPVPTDSTPLSTDPTDYPPIATGDPTDPTPIPTGYPTDSTPLFSDPTDSPPISTGDPTDSTPVPTDDSTDSTELPVRTDSSPLSTDPIDSTPISSGDSSDYTPSPAPTDSTTPFSAQAVTSPTTVTIETTDFTEIRSTKPSNTATVTSTQSKVISPTQTNSLLLRPPCKVCSKPVYPSFGTAYFPGDSGLYNPSNYYVQLGSYPNSFRQSDPVALTSYGPQYYSRHLNSFQRHWYVPVTQNKRKPQYYWYVKHIGT